MLRKTFRQNTLTHTMYRKRGDHVNHKNSQIESNWGPLLWIYMVHILYHWLLSPLLSISIRHLSGNITHKWCVKNKYLELPVSGPPGESPPYVSHSSISWNRYKNERLITLTSANHCGVIFDIFFHSSPFVFCASKVWCYRRRRRLLFWWLAHFFGSYYIWSQRGHLDILHRL